MGEGVVNFIIGENFEYWEFDEVWDVGLNDDLKRLFIIFVDWFVGIDCGFVWRLLGGFWVFIGDFFVILSKFKFLSVWYFSWVMLFFFCKIILKKREKNIF